MKKFLAPVGARERRKKSLAGAGTRPAKILEKCPGMHEENLIRVPGTYIRKFSAGAAVPGDVQKKVEEQNKRNKQSSQSIYKDK